MKLMKVRIRATGQVLEMVPTVAKRMIKGGTAEEVISTNSDERTPESMAVAPAAEHAVAPAQAGPRKKPMFSRSKSS